MEREAGHIIKKAPILISIFRSSHLISPRYYSAVIIPAVFLIIFRCHSPAFSESDGSPTQNNTSKKLTLVYAAMCKGIKDYTAVDPAIVFSIGIGKVSCFTIFDPVPEEMYIFHEWYNRDKLSTSQRLLLKPPQWSTFSTIQLREADKGPWRIEVLDEKGNTLQVLRFSITD